MKSVELSNAVFYNAEIDELYLFEDEYFDRIFLIGWGTIWHYIGEL